jgi:hypothetical protein
MLSHVEKEGILGLIWVVPEVFQLSYHLNDKQGIGGKQWS